MNKRHKIGHGYMARYNMTDGSMVRLVEDYITHSTTPELYDIEITDHCPNNCNYCYMNSDAENSKYMSLKDLEHLFEDHLDRHHNVLPFQVALGGGEPTLHPEFTEILKYIRSLDVIPNYTTSGVNLTYNILQATGKYCGGVALTYHKHLAGNNNKNFIKALNDLSTIRNKVNINVHLVIGRDNLQDIAYLMNNFSSQFDHLVLLGFKPLGRGIDQEVRLFDNAAKNALLAIAKKYFPTGRLAFDAGLVPFFTSYHRELGLTVDQAISGMPNIEAKYNAFIDVDLNIKPSSFYSGAGISLKEHDLIETWQEHKLFADVRAYQKNPTNEECKNCDVLAACKGGIYDPGMLAINRVNFCKHKDLDGASPFEILPEGDFDV